MTDGLHNAPRGNVMRAGMLLVLAALLAPALFAAARGGGLSLMPAGVVACLIVLGLQALLARALPNTLGPGGGRRWLFALWVVLSLGAAYRLAHLSVFMFDATQTDYSMTETIREFDDEKMEEPFLPKHNCFTSYIIATHLATNGAENIYVRDQYRDAEDTTPIHETIGENAAWSAV